MKANIPPFQIGDKAVSLVSGKSHCENFTIVKGKIYTVVDLKYDPDEYTIDGVDYLGVWIIWLDNGIGVHETHIRKVQEQKAPLLTFEKIKEEEKEEVLIMN